MQLHYVKDDDALEEYRAAKSQQAQQAQRENARKRRRSSSSSNISISNHGRKRQARPAAAAAAARPGAGATAPDSDDVEDEGADIEIAGQQGAQPSTSLDKQAKELILKGLAVVCPRQPNGRFMQRRSFQWHKGWAAFQRAQRHQLIAAMPCYASADEVQLHRDINDFTTQ